MAVDLGDFIDDVKSQVSAPGSNLFPDSTDDDWLLQLRNAFNEAILYGIITKYTEVDGSVEPRTVGDPDISRDLIQAVIYLASLQVLRTRLSGIQNVFRAAAGTVSYETQQDQEGLINLIKEGEDKLKIWLIRLSDIGVTKSYYFNLNAERDFSYSSGDISWYR